MEAGLYSWLLDRLPHFLIAGAGEANLLHPPSSDSSESPGGCGFINLQHFHERADVEGGAPLLLWMTKQSSLDSTLTSSITFGFLNVIDISLVRSGISVLMNFATGSGSSGLL